MTLRRYWVLIAALFGSPALAQQNTAPRLFAAGVISGPADDLSPAFAPDGRSVYFTRGNPNADAIVVSRLVDGQWTQPVIASFSGVWRDLEPTMAPDGSFLVFASSRPARPGHPQLDGHYNGTVAATKGGNLWIVDHLGNGRWGAPRRLPDSINRTDATFSPSIAGNGTIYFMSPAGDGGHFHLFRSRHVNGQYLPAEQLALGDSTTQEVDPAVAADESYLVYSSNHPGHSQPNRLHIVFRCNDGWSTPVDLGDAVNEEGSNIEARLGPGGTVLYFSTNTVPPVSYPRSSRDAARDAARMEHWANGRQNIWYVSLQSWIRPEARKQACARSLRGAGF